MATRRKVANGTFDANGTINHPSRDAALDTPVEDQSSSAIVDILQIYLPTFTLIFGGCCSNVYALEALVKLSPGCGSLITFLQFALTSLLTLPSNVSLRDPSSWRRAFLRKRHIPLRAWVIYTALFLTINILNNKAFSYRISVPLHIILRSAGPVTTMLVFYIWSGRRYPPVKIFAVLLLFVGVVVAAVSDAYSKTPEKFNVEITSAEIESSMSKLPLPVPSSEVLREQAPGFVLLAAALLLAAILGVYSDGLYARYGRGAGVTSESLFYSHTLSLPYFAFQTSALSTAFVNLTATSAPLSTSLATGPISKLPSVLSSIPTAIPLLLLNALTQYICINGVNRLSAKSSSLTVSIVLNIRKLASLLLSIWLFGNKLPEGVVVGAALVFLGGGLYAVPSGQKTISAEKKKE
ncbi:uncharacterized protein HMPREF1541_08065 [Cyphellophora europaea CBS 101466]|uniref:Sugar phosphate transporter domain-containing protein n=1 Tax=Cyphellophora europaea (strain CBS 101466) TaxID=1220924 RepID=W2RL75_CYPE1|nr:uncharacterized protein HMPREF1541_08065 [Cyphellophora europaea CBS 101466]ETN37075.1 hypothetical protein HMPREF1541_08065 [Cyphellophora europaea CBS 101466]